MAAELVCRWFTVLKMNRQEKRRIIFIVVTLLICCITAIVIKRVDNYIVGYADVNDIVKNISKRTGVKTDGISVDGVCEKGSYVFVSYQLDGDQASRLVYYQLTWRKILFRDCKILKVIGEISSNRSMDYSVASDGDNTILVFWGRNLPNSALTVSFEIDGAEVKKDLSCMHMFIEPFIFISSTSSPQQIYISSGD